MTTVRPIRDLDIPLPDVQAEAAELWAERDRRVAALNFRTAAERTNSPSDRLAYLLDAELVRHPEVCATDADYPGWAEHIAALQAANRTRKEA